MAESIKLERIAYEAMAASLGTDGVADMADSADALYYESFLVGDYKSRGVYVYLDNQVLGFRIYIKVKNNIVIPELAWNIQANVKKAIRSITRQSIGKIDVYVMGIVY